MQGGKLLPKTVIMHFTGATDYSADVSLTGPAAISRTKENYYILGNIKYRKVAYKTFISVNFGWLEYSLLTLSVTITQTFSKMLFFVHILQIFYPDHVSYSMTISRKVLWNCIAKHLYVISISSTLYLCSV